MPVWILAIVLSAAPEGPRPAAIPPVLDADGYRLYALGFEPETDDRDLNGRPDVDRWERVRGTAYPFYCRCVLDGDRPRDGRSALRLEPDRASVALRTLPLPVDRFHGFEVAGWVRTRDLERAAARIDLEWLAEDGRTVLQRVRSAPLAGTGDWRPVGFVTEPPQDLGLRWMRVVLSVEAGPAGSDLDAVAWFDAIQVRERPRAALRTREPANLFPADQPDKTVTLFASGLSSERMPARLVLADVHGREVLAADLVLEAESGATAVGRFALDLTEPGLYEARVTVGRPTSPLVTRRLWLAVAPCGVRASEGPDLGVALGPGPLPPGLPKALERIGCRLVKVPVWDTPGEDRPDALIHDLRARDVNVVGVLRAKAGSPGGIAVRLATALEQREEALGLAIAQYTGRVGAWQLGDDADRSLCGVEDLGAPLGRLSQTAGALARDQPFGAAWSALYPLPPVTKGLHFVNVDIGPEIPPENIPAHLGGGAVPCWATIHPLDRTRFGREARLRDLVRRVVSAKRAGARCVFVSPLVDDRIGLLREDGSPTETLLVWRTLTEMLDGLPYVGELPLPEGTPNALFATGNRAVLCLWSPAGTRAVRLGLGSATGGAVGPPERIDLLGRRQPLTSIDGECHLSVGPMPVFVTGIEAGLAATCASLRIDAHQRDRRPTGDLFVAPAADPWSPHPAGPEPHHLESEYRWHPRALRFSNRCAGPIRGQLSLVSPAGWRVVPSAIWFDLEPGADLERPIKILFPYSAVCGTTTLRAQWLIAGDRPLKACTAVPIRLDLSGISMQTAVAWMADGSAAIDLRLANASRERLRGSCYVTVLEAAGAGVPTAESGVFLLPAGGRVQQRYVLGAAQRLAGRTVRISLRELGGKRFLNHDVVIPARTPDWRAIEPEPADGDEPTQPAWP